MVAFISKFEHDDDRDATAGPIDCSLSSLSTHFLFSFREDLWPPPQHECVAEKGRECQGRLLANAHFGEAAIETVANVDKNGLKQPFKQNTTYKETWCLENETNIRF